VQSCLSYTITAGQEATDKTFSLVVTNPHPLRLVVLKEDLLMIMDAIGRAGGLNGKDYSYRYFLGLTQIFT
jgi:hypothetical protein